jgi:uncharacterized protein with gpF-like domain
MPKDDLLSLPFTEQLAYFRRKTGIPADTLKGVQSEYHDWAFSVSGLTRADLVRDLMALIDRAIAEGMSIEEFQQVFYRLIGRKGWTPVEIDRKAPIEAQVSALAANNRRLYTILDTNHRRSHSAGRIQQMRSPTVLKSRPYWQWQWRDSVTPRPHHQAIDQKVFHASEDFWNYCFPPCGFGCRCTVISLSEKDLKRYNLKPEKAPPSERFIEPYFNRSAGTSSEQDRREFVQQGLSKQSPALRAILEKELDN